MKKFISVLLVTILSVMCALPCFAAEVTNPINEEITVYNLYTNVVTATVTNNSSGTISYSCRVSAKSNATKISAYAYLQEYRNGVWTNVDCVTKEVNGQSLLVSDTYSGISGRSYRCEVHVYTYSGAKYEYIETTSSTIKKS